MTVLAPRYDRPLRAGFAAPLGGVTLPLVAMATGFSVLLWPAWTSDPDLSHGLFAPVVFALLVWEGIKNGTPRWLRSGPAIGWMVGAALLAALLALTMAGLLAASIGWSHAVVQFLFAVVLTATLTAGLLVLAGDQVRAVPFNWQVLTAIALWLLVAPLPPGTYSRLTLALQGAVTSGVLNALHVLGIPARQIGNVIELATTSVGVEEACSGIRSLISCLYAGFFFAAWLVPTPGRRAVLIATAPLLAIVMNYFRSLGLTLMANAGVDITGFWHDATGYAILGLTAAALAGLAALFGRPLPEPVRTAPVPAVVRSPLFAAFAVGAGSLAAVALTFAVLTHRSADAAAAPAVLDVASLLPETGPGWQLAPGQDLYRFSGILQTRHLAEKTYYRFVDGQPVQVNAYVAHWPAGAAPVSLVASHTPDACWPGAGWQPDATSQRQMILDVNGGQTPIAEHRVFRRGPYPQHVWFWHIYNGRVINYRDPYSVPALLEIALRYGFRREGDQYFVRVTSNQPWEKLRDDPLVRELFTNFQRVGLRTS